MEAPSQEIVDAAMVDGLKDVAFGSVAGMISKVFEHPFDLCKVRLQAQVLDATARFKGPVDCLVTTWNKEGLRGLYRGLPAPIVGAMAENASLFLAYGQLQHLCRWWSGSPTLSTSQVLLSAAGAGAATSFLLTPIELVKCKMQVQLLALETYSPAVALAQGGTAVLGAGRPTSATSKPNFRSLPGPVSVLKTVLQTHGLRGLWLGQTGTLIRETGGAAAWFGTKEGVCEILLRRRRRYITNASEPLTSKGLKAWESAFSGACAGIAYNVILFPADSVKSALQTAEELRPHDHRSGPAPTFWGTARDMFRRQGIRGLYAGMGVTVARAIPSNAIIFLVYDGLSKRFG